MDEYDCWQKFKEWAEKEGYLTSYIVNTAGEKEFGDPYTNNAWLGFKKAFELCSNGNIQQRVQGD